MAPEPDSSIDAGETSKAIPKTTGDLKVLIVRVDMADLTVRKATGGRLTDYKLKYFWFGGNQPGYQNLNEFFNLVSYNKLNLVGDVVNVRIPLYTTSPSTDGDVCLKKDIKGEVIKALRAKKIKIKNYDKVGFFHPAPKGCALSAAEQGGRYFWVTALNPPGFRPKQGAKDIGTGVYLSVWAHELGHTLGLDHVGKPFPNDSIWSYVSFVGNEKFGNRDINNYLTWDRSNIMGSTDSVVYLNSDQLAYLGWLAPQDYPTVPDGIYTINCVSDTPGSNKLPVAIKIPRTNGNRHYSINYRCSDEYDAQLPTPYTRGVTVFADHYGFIDPSGKPEYESPAATKQVGLLSDGAAMLDEQNNIEIIQVGHVYSQTATVALRRRSSRTAGQYSRDLLTGTLKNDTGSCLDGSAGSVSPRSCSGATSQNWVIEMTTYGSIKKVRVYLKGSGACLALNPDGKFTLDVCTGDEVNQLWDLQVDRATGRLKITTVGGSNTQSFFPVANN